MRYLLLLIALVLLMAAHAQDGKFPEGVEMKKLGVTLRPSEVHSGPACRYSKNCPWMAIWSTTKIRADTVEINVYPAGGGIPETAVVPTALSTPLDKHNSIFLTPINRVHRIEFTFRRGDKEIKNVVFE